MRLLYTAMTAAALAVVPAASHAQTPTASTTQDLVVKENTTVVVKEAPKPAPVTFTPYGFLLLNAYFNDAAGGRNYPLPSVCTTGAACEGNLLIDVRQTRLGARLAFDDKAGWTGATLSALVEVDFNGGYTSTTNSSSFYNPSIRLRKAYADASWGESSKFTLRLGQDDRLISPLRPVSLAYVANPLFQNAGLLHGRAPMFALRYDYSQKHGLNFSAAVAALNPQDNTAADNGVSPGVAVDLGAGNRSRMPDFEGRVGAGWRMDGKTLANLGLWGGIQKNRFVNPNADANVDVNSWIYGADLTLNVAFLQFMGEIYKSAGYDVPGTLGASQGIGLSFATPATTPPTLTNASAIPAFGGWVQLAARPIEPLQIYGGWGGTQSPTTAYAGTVFQNGAGSVTPAQAQAATRVQNYMWAAGVIGYAGKNWRFSAEYGRATSFFLSGASFTQGQFSVNTQLVF